MATSKTARAVHANVGIEMAYREALMHLIDQMHSSVQYWITAAYRKYPPRVAKLAMDAPPSDAMRKVIAGLVGRWAERFDDEAEAIADKYIGGAFKASGASFARSLSDAGWSIKFKMTPAMRDALSASLQENVSLIKSIPAEYLQQVEGSVMRSYTAGRDLEAMVKELRELYPRAANRAVTIARDQSNKANATVNRTAQLELGITQAKWLHSAAGRHPRESHIKANGSVYDIAKGCYIDREYIQPGQLINCRCVSRPILPF